MKFSQTKKRHEINTRAVITFREIGKSNEAMKTLCGFKNIPPPMTQKSFSEIHCCSKIMIDAAVELRGR